MYKKKFLLVFFQKRCSCLEATTLTDTKKQNLKLLGVHLLIYEKKYVYPWVYALETGTEGTI